MASLHTCARSSRALRTLITSSRCREVTLPAFLVPAFAQSSQFSTTAQCASKIGAAALSLPPDVTFTLHEAPAPKQGQGISKVQQGATVEIAGPLGKMSYAIPPYMTITSNEANRTHTLNIQNSEDRKQREMWGMLPSLPRRRFHV